MTVAIDPSITIYCDDSFHEGERVPVGAFRLHSGVWDWEEAERDTPRGIKAATDDSDPDIHASRVMGHIYATRVKIFCDCGTTKPWTAAKRTERLSACLAAGILSIPLAAL